MDGLAGAYGRQIAVTLIGEDQTVGIQTLDGRSYGACASVGSLDPIHVDIFVCEDRAPDGRDGYSRLLESHLVDHLGDQLVHRAVAAARTVVHHVVGYEARLGIYQIFGFYFYLCHDSSIL